MLLKCKCGAKHDPNIRWQRVRYPPNDTSGAYYPGSLIDAGHCPICKRLPIRIERMEMPICPM